MIHHEPSVLYLTRFCVITGSMLRVLDQLKGGDDILPKLSHQLKHVIPLANFISANPVFRGWDEVSRQYMYRV